MKTKVGCALVVVLTACGGAVETSSSDEPHSGASSSALTLPSQAAVPLFAVPSIPVCPGPAAIADARCHSHVVTDERGHPNAFSNYTSGLAPADLQAAYGVPFNGTSSTATNGPTIAIVDAYDNPNAEADLGVYRTTFGLPPCTTSNGCFKKINQRGGSKPPRANSGWGLEIALDVQMASAICPTCHILLVEADSSSFTNLMTAVNQAASQGAVVVGGTSVSAPIVASVYALAGNVSSLTYASGPYANTSSLNDVTSGSNGSCAGTYLCTAVAGYDGPTGLGTPIGTGAF